MGYGIVILQILSMVTMTIDHVGLFLFSDLEWMRFCGRLAMPIYLFFLVKGYTYTSSITRYVKRLFFLFLLSQPTYFLMFKSFTINILGTFLFIFLSFYCIDQKSIKYKIFFLLTIFFLEVLPFDYGSYALFLALIYRFENHFYRLIGHMILNVVFCFFTMMDIQVISVLSTFLINHFYSNYDKSFRIPSWIWRSFYPVHLLMIYLVQINH